LFLEVDALNSHKVIQDETGKKIPTTFTVKSSEQRGHFYFKHNSFSIAMGNLQGRIDGKEAWSVRASGHRGVQMTWDSECLLVLGIVLMFAIPWITDLFRHFGDRGGGPPTHPLPVTSSVETSRGSGNPKE
jgi:hypothetical protein